MRVLPVDPICVPPPTLEGDYTVSHRPSRLAPRQHGAPSGSRPGGGPRRRTRHPRPEKWDTSVARQGQAGSDLLPALNQAALSLSLSLHRLTPRGLPPGPTRPSQGFRGASRALLRCPLFIAIRSARLASCRTSLAPHAWTPPGPPPAGQQLDLRHDDPSQMAPGPMSKTRWRAERGRKRGAEKQSLRWRKYRK